MNLKKILIFILIIILLLTITFIALNPLITGNIIKSDSGQEIYIHTKAICNSSNFCQDYVITCQNKTLINSKPITGAVIQHSDDWQDPRTNPKQLCE